MVELLFNGVTAYAREEEQKWSAPLLAIRPHRGQFDFKVLPPERLISIEVVPSVKDSHWGVELRGEFSRVGDEDLRVIGPMADIDARGMARALAAHYALPRTPIDVAPAELVTLTRDTYVTVIGKYNEHHCDMANFEGVRLHPSDRKLRLHKDRTYRVTGFLQPGAPPGSPIHVGYNGAVLTGLEIVGA